MQSIARGVALVYSGGYPVSALPETATQIARGDVIGIPYTVLIMAVILAMMWFILRCSKFGRYVFAIGGNEECARLSGVKVKTVKVIVYAVSGIMSGLAGLLVAFKMASAQPTLGNSYELDAITAVALGGTSLAGGKGNMLGTVIGCLFLTVLSTGFPSLNSMRERVAGFLEIVEEYPDIEIMEHDFSANTFEAGQQLTDDLMQLYPEGSFDILYGANCAPGLGGLNSAEINGRTDFDVITVDNIEQFITACEKGVGATVLKGFVSQDPIDMGMTAMELAVAAAKGEDTGEYLHATAISLVTPENVDDFMSNYQKMSDMIAPFR